ncbi:MAG: hypothetical protein ACYDBP_10530 [Leptospirales bacterium]
MIYPDQSDYRELLRSIANALNDSFHNLNQKEPQLVANLVWNLPNYVNNARFTSFLVKCGGIFVHAQPFVKSEKFPDKKPASVEIGDLLLLRTEIHEQKVMDRRALLLQAKKTNTFPAAPDNNNQYYLYAHWPPFTYIRSGGLSQKKRSVSGPDLCNGAKYLMISDCYHMCSYYSFCLLCASYPCLNSCSITNQASGPVLSHHRCFLDELISFVLSDSGKPFIKPPKSRIGWDRVIDDLIKETSKKCTVFMGQASKSKNKDPRGNQTQFFFHGISSISHGLLAPSVSSIRIGQNPSGNSGQEPPTIEGPWPEGNEETSGISMIEFVVSTE